MHTIWIGDHAFMSLRNLNDAKRIARGCAAVYKCKAFIMPA